MERPLQRCVVCLGLVLVGRNIRWSHTTTPPQGARGPPPSWSAAVLLRPPYLSRPRHCCKEWIQHALQPTAPSRPQRLANRTSVVQPLTRLPLTVCSSQAMVTLCELLCCCVVGCVCTCGLGVVVGIVARCCLGCHKLRVRRSWLQVLYVVNQCSMCATTATAACGTAAATIATRQAAHVAPDGTGVCVCASRGNSAACPGRNMCVGLDLCWPAIARCVTCVVPTYCA